MIRATVLTLAAAFAPIAAVAEICDTATTAKCIIVPVSLTQVPQYQVGDEFPVYDHNMVIDISRHKLTPVDGAWRYYAVEYDIYKVDARDFRVIEVMASAALR